MNNRKCRKGPRNDVTYERRRDENQSEDGKTMEEEENDVY